MIRQKFISVLKLLCASLELQILWHNGQRRPHDVSSGRTRLIESSVRSSVYHELTMYHLIQKGLFRSRSRQLTEESTMTLECVAPNNQIDRFKVQLFIQMDNCMSFHLLILTHRWYFKNDWQKFQ